MDIAKEIQILLTLQTKYQKDVNDVCKKIGSGGYSNLFKYLLKTYSRFYSMDVEYDSGLENLVTCAVKNGNINIIKLIIKHELYIGDKDNLMYIAAENKQLCMIKYLLSINHIEYETVDSDSDDSNDYRYERYNDSVYYFNSSSLNTFTSIQAFDASEFCKNDIPKFQAISGSNP